MESGQTGKLLRHLRQVLQPQAARECDDGELLGRFASVRDEAAFTALMLKHGRLVWRVCRRVLDHEHDAEDAFQGTFLVLARKAASIRKQRSVASWLYGVAYRISRKAKVAAARRRKHESRATPMAAGKPRGADCQSALPSEMAWRELQAILDEELTRLSEKYRAPFVLCCLDGKSKKEAAEELGWKEGTVSSRLAGARKLLQQRLARRGVMLSALLSGTALSETTAAAASLALGAATVKAALAFAAGQTAGAPAAAIELAEALLRSMAAVKLKLGVVLFILLSVAGTSVWALRHSSDNTGARPPEADHRAEPPRQAQPAAVAAITKSNRHADGQMTVSGRVVGSDGQPLGHAKIAIVAGELRRPGERGLESGKRILKSGQADARGDFRLALERPSVLRHFNLGLLAVADGHAPRWYALSPRGDHDRLVCELETGRAVRGRLVDAQGKPANQVQVHVVGMAQAGAGMGALRFSDPADGLTAWPAPVVTDQAGEFVFPNAGSNGELDLQVRDNRFAPQWLVLKPAQKGTVEPATFTLQPRRTLEGTVTCADTGRPMPGAYVLVTSGVSRANPLLGTTTATADEQGRFRLAPYPGEELKLVFYPAPGAPYRVMQRSLRWPGEAMRHELHFSLPRGVLVRGRVVEVPSGSPVANATIEYEPRSQDNPDARNENGVFSTWWLQDARSRADGGFEIVVPPGPGWLLVKSLTPDFIHVAVSARQLECGKPGGNPYFPDALVPLDLKSNTRTHEVVASLRRGVTVSGRVLAHDGSPATTAFVLAPTYRPQQSAHRGGLSPMRLATHDGRFELPGCDPERSMPVFFFDIGRDQGAVVDLAGKRAQTPPIRLAPCGSATARFVDNSGRPISRPKVWLDVLLRPGADLQESIEKQVDACVTVSALRLWGKSCIDVDAQKGLVTFAPLIPGATYLVQTDEGNGTVRKATIIVRPGERVALPDIVLRSPAVGKS
jgi:RNA polymerase sigma factor (sigma-70 family)